MALSTRLFELVEDRRIGDASPLLVNSIGEALLTVKQTLNTRVPQFIESAYSITLFGDPAPPLR